MAAFKAEVFEELHGGAVARLVAGVGSREAEAELFEDVRKHKDALSKPFVFRPREESLDLSALARHVTAECPRLASEPLVRAVDEVSRNLRLHQHDCCALVDKALGLSGNTADLSRRCAAVYYRECHFLALCLHDMAQGLLQRPHDRCSVAFFAMLGGRRFIKALFEGFEMLLRDLASERTGDQMFTAHAGAVIQLLVETLLVYFSAFQATAEEAEQAITLLPHVVMSSQLPLGQGFSISDLDLILRDDHVDIGVKLCLALLCMIAPQVCDGKLDISRAPENLAPAAVRVQELVLLPGGTGVLESPLGAKIKAGDYWNEENPLGQFLCFAINGIVLEDERAMRSGYIHWHSLQFILHEILLSPSMVGQSPTSRLVLKCIHDLLRQALLPVGRRWAAVRTLEAQAVSHRVIAPDALQTVALQTLNRLCRVYPEACDTFRELALSCTDTFHLSAHSPLLEGGGGLGLWTQPSMSFDGQSAIGGRSTREGLALWSGVASSAGSTAVAGLPGIARHDSTALYAEILDLLASVCARGSLHNTSRLVCQRLAAHSNQAFNWAFLVDALARSARVSVQAAAAASSRSVGSGHVAVAGAVCRLISAVCSSRLWVSQPPPQTSLQALQSSFGSVVMSPDSFATLLTDVLGSHPEPAVKAACLGALGHFDLSPAAAKGAFASLTAVLPSLLVGISDIRGCSDGALAIELLTCALALVQVVPLGKGRYSMDLQPLTHVVIHHIFAKVLTEMAHFTSASRYWRLAALALRWLRLALRGPMPLGASAALNSALIEPYADSDGSAAEVALRSSAGSATTYVFRCLLALDSPIFARVLYLTLLRGRSVDGLLEGRRGNAARPFMEQTVRAGLDVVRVLLQRDVLFCRLYGQHAADRAAGPGGADLDAGNLLLAHRLLLSEFAFPYPPTADDGSRGSTGSLNSFASRRLWQGATSLPSAAGAGGRRPNPSYFALLLEFVGAHGSPDICRLAIFTFAQAALREPNLVLRALQLEPWRLQRLCTDVHDLLARPEEDSTAAALSGPHGRYGQHAEALFMFEAVEVDLPADPSAHLDVVSFQTGLPICSSLDLVYQVADDAVVQLADLSAWAHCLTGVSAAGSGFPGTAGTDTWQLHMGYLRGMEIPPDWLGPEVPGGPSHAGGMAPPPPVLAGVSCRLLALRTLVLLLSSPGPQGTASLAPKLAQVLLGLDADGAPSTGAVDVDLKRAGQPSPLDAVMALLENPPPTPEFRERPGMRGGGPLAVADTGVAQAVEQHATYEAALGVLLALLAAPPLREVALRFLCYAWPSRYQVLRGLLAMPWRAVPLPLRRVLLSETALMLQAAAWEMRIVQPAGMVPPAAPDQMHLAGHQRLEMRRTVAEHLQEVVRSFGGPAEAGGPAGDSPPFLVAAALQLAEACESPEETTRPATLAFRDARQGLWRASACRCLAPADAGSLALCLELHDPYILSRLSGGGGAQALELPLSPRRAAAAAAGAAGSARATSGREEVALAQADTQADVTASNRATCVSFLSRAVLKALGLFIPSALYHLANGPRPSSADPEPRGQGVLAHLEALLPELTDASLARCSPGRLEFLAGLSSALMSAVQQVEGRSPVGLVQELLALLRGLALHPQGTLEMRRHAHEAMLLLLQRMSPGLSSPASHAVVGSAEDLRRLVNSLLDHACKTMESLVCHQADIGVALPLLTALLLRVPPPQLDHVLSGHDVWVKLHALLSAGPSAGGAPGLQVAGPAASRGGQSALRFQATSAAAVLCQRPGLAAAFFESGCLAKVLELDFANSIRGGHIAPPSLDPLDRAHPSAVLAVLQVLVAVTGALPAHQLALLGIVTWLERHQRPLMELVQWVAKLPATPGAEPRSTEPPLDPGSGVQAAAAVAAASGGASGGGGGTGGTSGGPQVVLCTLPEGGAAAASGSDALRPAGAAAAPPLPLALAPAGGGFGQPRGARGPEAAAVAAAAARASPPESAEEVVALSYSCVARLAELWALLQRHAAGGSPALLARLRHLEPVFDAAFLPLLAQMACSFSQGRPWQGGASSAAGGPLSGEQFFAGAGAGGGSPLGRPVTSPADAAAGGAVAVGPGPQEAGRLALCLHVLHGWRYDSTAQACLGRPAAGGRSPELLPGLVHGHPDFAQGHGAPAQQWALYVRARAGVLCTTFIHACAALLSVRSTSAAGAPTGLSSLAEPRLAFTGTRAEYELLHAIVEVSLHTLQVHLAALASGVDFGGSAGLLPASAAPGGGAWGTAPGAAGYAGQLSLAAAAPALAPPRLALVVEYLRCLRLFSEAVGGAVLPQDMKPVPEEYLPREGPEGRPEEGALDLSFAACVAEQVEELLLELQSL